MSLDKFGRSSAPRSLPQLKLQRGFLFTEDGNIDIGKLRLCNVHSPSEGTDASTKEYVDSTTERLYNSVHQTAASFSVQVDDIGEQVTSIMNRIQELDQFLNSVILNDLHTLNELSRETGEKLSQISSAYEDRFKQIEQFISFAKIEIENIKRAVGIM